MILYYIKFLKTKQNIQAMTEYESKKEPEGGHVAKEEQ